jgi:hypothetical protein
VIALDMEQGSLEWHMARLGIPTSSRFGSIITPLGVPSKGEGYIGELADAWLIGQPDPDSNFENYWMKRGKLLEPEARALYCMMRDVEVQEVGFVFRDAMRREGCSPDGLVGEDGGWECKTPKLSTHREYLLAGVLPATYRPQVQGSMWITGRKWWDFMSFHPLTQPLIVRVERDDEYIRKLEIYMKAFLSDLNFMKKKLEKFKL